MVHVTLHIWMNSHIFPKHYNLYKICIGNGELCRTNPHKKYKLLFIIECILKTVWKSFYYIAIYIIILNT